MSATKATATRVRYPPLIAAVTTALIGTLIGIALIGLTPIPGVADPGVVVLVAIPLVRIVLDIAAVVTIGLCLLSVLLGYDRPKQTELIARRARRAAVAAALVWSVSALVALLLQTAEFQAAADAVGPGDVWDYVVGVGAGKALLIVAVLAAAHAALGVLAVRHGEKVPAEARVGLGLFALLPLPVTGHASNWDYHDYTMISMELHVMSAVAWTGGLGAMAVLLASNRALLAHALPRFSKLATICILVSACTGLFNGIVEIQLNPTMSFWEGTFETPYGLLFLGKLLCLGAIAVVGARMRWRLLPAITAQRHTAFVTWAALELTIMGLAFGFAVMLTRAPVA
ncbi:MAG: copper resistance protein CopD [Actinophytocola sp.]|nr:copper resistance protein CopD [Actinophytocola sp.]